MFGKWSTETDDAGTDNNDNLEKKRTDVQTPGEKNMSKDQARKTAGDESVNTILKGSKLTGDINITCDLELSGDVEGNITSLQDSNIVIKGSCKGNIETKEGSVDIDGELKNGNIIAGGDITVNGKFSNGEIKAQGRLYVNGEFEGRLEGNEIEIGPDAHGKGELFYKEFISISKGAQVETRISRVTEELKLVKKPSEQIKSSEKEAAKGQA